MKAVLTCLLMKVILTCLLISMLKASEENEKSYYGYQLIRTIPKHDEQLRLLMQLKEDPQLDFWTEPAIGKSTEVNVPPYELQEFKEKLDKAKLQFDIVQKNVQFLIDERRFENILTIRTLKIMSASGYFDSASGQNFQVNSDDNDPELQVTYDSVFELLKADPSFYDEFFAEPDPEPPKRIWVGFVLKPRFGRSISDGNAIETEKVSRKRRSSRSQRFSRSRRTSGSSRTASSRTSSKNVSTFTTVKPPTEFITRTSIMENKKIKTPFNIVNLYPRHDDLEDWLQDMAKRFPDLVRTEKIGTTFEDRSMTIIKIGYPRKDGADKPIIWVDSALHAREWLTVGTSVWIIYKLIKSNSTDPTVQELLNHYDWYFLPVANPDGYEYTHDTDRLWRKTRSKSSLTNCHGTDPNRNWGYKWGVSDTSTNECADTFGGQTAFTEKCTKNIRNAVTRYAHNIKLYISMHAYGKMWLLPWGWGTEKPDDYDELFRVASLGAEALKAVRGTEYTLGTPGDLLYPSSGTSADWAKKDAGVKYTYTLELGPSSDAVDGFIIDEESIPPTGKEIWAALARIAQELKNMES